MTQFCLAAVVHVHGRRCRPGPGRSGDAGGGHTFWSSSLMSAARSTEAMAQNVAAMRSGYAMRSQLAQQPGFVQAYQANKAKFDPALQKAGAIQADVAQKVIDANIDAVVAEATRAYARNYTTAELEGAADFLPHPARQGAVHPPDAR